MKIWRNLETLEDIEQCRVKEEYESLGIFIHPVSFQPYAFFMRKLDGEICIAPMELVTQ